MTKVKATIFGTILLLSILVVLSAASACAPEAKAVVWRGQAPTNLEYPTTTVIVKTINDELKTATNGRLQFEFYPLNGLGVEQSAYLQGVGKGLLQAAETWATHVVGDLPLLDVISVPGVFVPRKEVAFEAGTKFYEVARPYFEAALATRNIKLLGINHVAARALFSKKPVKNIADIKGMVIRTGGPTEAGALKTWGASPTSLTWAEITVGLQRGTLDGYMSACDGVITQKLWDLAPYAFDLGWATTNPLFIANMDAFKALTPADQKALMDMTHQRYELENMKFNVGEGDLKVREQLKGYKMTFTDPPSNILQLTTEAGKESIDTWLSRTGPTGKELYDKLKQALAPYNK